MDNSETLLTLDKQNTEQKQKKKKHKKTAKHRELNR
jgi:hypothetical protein